MAPADRDLQAAIAVTRFGMGARPGEIAEARQDPRGFLTAQIGIAPEPAERAVPAQRVAAIGAFQRVQDRYDKFNAAGNSDAQKLQPELDSRRRVMVEQAHNDLVNRAAQAVRTPAGFAERWALFWSNHFTVAGPGLIREAVVGPYEAYAIRPHIFGRFADLVISAETHPAMLLYLDQHTSAGPNSELAKSAKGRRPGLNENLAREILELHTVGVDGGYSQTDVTEFARALTGLRFHRFAKEPTQAGKTYFHLAAHEPGPKSILGVSYSTGGLDEVETILRDLAARPQTARFVSRKIARHFVADDPSPKLCRRLEDVWLKTDGALDEVARALIEAPEAWEPKARKFKTPYEFVVSAWRATNTGPKTYADLSILISMGHKPLTAPSPAGWPDEEPAWATPDGLIKRLAWTQGLAPKMVGQTDPTDLAQAALGVRVTPTTAQAIRRAESRAEGLALLLMSPEFQRR